MTKITYPFLYPGTPKDILPGAMAHLLGSSTPLHPTDKFACFQMDNTTTGAVGVKFHVNVPGYANPIDDLRQVPKGVSSQCLTPTPNLNAIYGNTGPVDASVEASATLASDGSTLALKSYPVTIMPGDYAKWSGTAAEEYVAAFSTPNNMSIVNLLNPLSKYSRWGTFGVGGYNMHAGQTMTPTSVNVPSSSYVVADSVYFEANETITFKLSSVSGGTSNNIDFYVFSDSDFQKFAAAPCAGGVPTYVNGTGSTSGAQYTIGPLPPGWYNLTLLNNCSNFVSRDVTYTRTGTHGDTVMDVLASIYQYLHAQGLVYTNVNTDFFNGTNGFGKLRWPAASLISNSANCADGSVLFATIAERLNLEPVLIHVTDPSLPHMFMGVWSQPGGKGLLWPIETTMVGTDPNPYNAVNYSIDEYNNHTTLPIDIRKARMDGITPIPK